MGYASPPRHWALTNSRPSADVTLTTLRVVDLAAALLEGLLNILWVIWIGSGTSKMPRVIEHKIVFNSLLVVMVVVFDDDEIFLRNDQLFAIHLVQDLGFEDF